MAVVGGALGLSTILLFPWLSKEFVSGLTPRLDYWGAAIRVIGKNPWLGTGPDTFGQYYFRFRSSGQFRSELAEDVHSIPLSMLQGGGVILACAWLTLVIATSVLFARCLKASACKDRLLVVAFGGGFAAYLAQAVVSIDVTPLLISPLLFGAAIATYYRQANQVPGSTTSDRISIRRFGSLPIRWLAPALAGSLAVAGIWASLLPLRAEAATDASHQAIRAGNLQTALSEAEEAIALAPWKSDGYLRKGAALERLGRMDEAISAALEAAKIRPGQPGIAILLGRLYFATNQSEDALKWYRRAGEVDPVNPDTLTEVARGLLLHGYLDEAERVIARGIAQAETADLWALRGRQRALAGDPSSARSAYERALKINPGHREAMAYLGRSDP